MELLFLVVVWELLGVKSGSLVVFLVCFVEGIEESCYDDRQDNNFLIEREETWCLLNIVNKSLLKLRIFRLCLFSGSWRFMGVFLCLFWWKRLLSLHSAFWFFNLLLLFFMFFFFFDIRFFLMYRNFIIFKWVAFRLIWFILQVEYWLVYFRFQVDFLIFRPFFAPTSVSLDLLPIFNIAGDSKKFLAWFPLITLHCRCFKNFHTCFLFII